MFLAVCGIFLADICIPADAAFVCCKFFSDGPKNEKKFALTFDDGPGKSTRAALKILAENNAKASFFVLGEAARAHPDLISEIAKAGHMVCNHTDTHVNYYKLKSAAREAILEKEIKTAEDSIKRAGGIRPLYLRLPNGFSGKWARETVFRLGYSLVNWTYGSDWTQLGREEMLKGYLRNLRPGSILLLHDGGEKEREKTLWLVGRILEDARKKGLKPVRLDELLEPENKN